MTKGITEAQVHTAADALVAAGERPTVERIRAHLGTGSPNTVTRLLDFWWQALGARLTAHQAIATIPDAPAEIAALAGQWWAWAWQQARETVQAEVAGERAQLASDRAALDREREALQQKEVRQQQLLAQAQQAETAMAARLADIQRLVEQQAAQLVDLTQQREALETRNERLEAEFLNVTTRLQAQETTAAAERETLTQQLRATEDHGHAEVDRARQESKGLRTRLAAMEKERTTERERHQHELVTLRTSLTTAQQDVAAYRARVETLEPVVMRC
ncbi:DNA-binding protein [Dyella sp. M7H15-1]|uniref:DNA-binding protein n=1 Tax=Dyella sp. M7H15-1 TaxID=2501295 RepID=UPI00100525D3|nr:DNA-binding protein [Dyella sp. M7H15-1]QAU23107.1 DNA-binding protein [Dyella sp. M7H15-1]